MGGGWKNNWIPDDGYTEAAYVRESPGLYGTFRFSYRPLLVELRSEINAGFKALSAADCERKAAEVIAAQVKTWDLVHPRTGQPVEITAANVLRLRPELFARVWGIVQGVDPTDTDPAWTEKQRLEAASLAHQAAVDGISPGAIREASDEKNSAGG